MEKSDGSATYQSEGILGQLYNRVLEHPINKELRDVDNSNFIANSSSNSSGSSTADTLVSVLAAQQQLLRVPGVSPGCDKGAWRRAAGDELEVFERELLELMTHWHVADVGE